MRTARDKTLGMPRLILPSVQVNMRAGQMPPPEENGRQLGDVFHVPLPPTATASLGILRFWPSWRSFTSTARGAVLPGDEVTVSKKHFRSLSYDDILIPTQG